MVKMDEEGLRCSLSLNASKILKGTFTETYVKQLRPSRLENTLKKIIAFTKINRILNEGADVENQTPPEWWPLDRQFKNLDTIKQKTQRKEWVHLLRDLTVNSISFYRKSPVDLQMFKKKQHRYCRNLKNQKKGNVVEKKGFELEVNDLGFDECGLLRGGFFEVEQSPLSELRNNNGYFVDLDLPMCPKLTLALENTREKAMEPKPKVLRRVVEGKLVQKNKAILQVNGTSSQEVQSNGVSLQNGKAENTNSRVILQDNEIGAQNTTRRNRLRARDASSQNTKSMSLRKRTNPPSVQTTRRKQKSPMKLRMKKNLKVRYVIDKLLNNAFSRKPLRSSIVLDRSFRSRKSLKVLRERKTNKGQQNVLPTSKRKQNKAEINKQQNVLSKRTETNDTKLSPSCLNNKHMIGKRNMDDKTCEASDVFLGNQQESKRKPLVRAYSCLDHENQRIGTERTNEAHRVCATSEQEMQIAGRRRRSSNISEISLRSGLRNCRRTSNESSKTLILSQPLKMTLKKVDLLNENQKDGLSEPPKLSKIELTNPQQDGLQKTRRISYDVNIISKIPESICLHKSSSEDFMQIQQDGKKEETNSDKQTDQNGSEKSVELLRRSRRISRDVNKCNPGLLEKPEIAVNEQQDLAATSKRKQKDVNDICLKQNVLTTDDKRKQTGESKSSDIKITAQKEQTNKALSLTSQGPISKKKLRGSNNDEVATTSELNTTVKRKRSKKVELWNAKNISDAGTKTLVLRIRRNKNQEVATNVTNKVKRQNVAEVTNTGSNNLVNVIDTTNKESMVQAIATDMSEGKSIEVGDVINVKINEVSGEAGKINQEECSKKEHGKTNVPVIVDTCSKKEHDVTNTIKPQLNVQTNQVLPINEEYLSNESLANTSFQTLPIIKLHDILVPVPVKPVPKSNFMDFLKLKATPPSDEVPHENKSKLSENIRYSHLIPFSSELGKLLIDKERYRITEENLDRKTDKLNYYLKSPPPKRHQENEYEVTCVKKNHPCGHLYNFPSRKFAGNEGYIRSLKETFCKPVSVQAVNMDFDEYYYNKYKCKRLSVVLNKPPE